MPSEAQKEAYKNFMKVFDGVEHLVKVAEHYANDSAPYVKDLQKMVDVVEKHTQDLLNTFYKHVESGKELSKIDKLKIEKAAKEINMAVQHYLSRVNAN